ncbi:MAG: beta strand repeat-containing protein, partial [Bacteroidales bacterium]
MKKTITYYARLRGLKLMAILFALLLFSGQSWGQTNILSENFSSISSGDNTTTGGSGTTWAGDTNFVTLTSAYNAGGAVKIGTSSAIGSITSKSIDLSVNGGNFKIKFKVKGWTTVEGNIKVTVTGLTAQTVTYTSTIAGSFEQKELTFTGGTSGSTVKFETTAKRAFLDDIIVYYNVAPTVTSDATPSAISATTATFGGNVTDTGGVSISANGFVYALTATNATPAISGSGVTQLTNSSPASGKGTFSLATSSALSVNSQYSYRAYATNSVGTSYGGVSGTNFYTLANIPSAPTVNNATSNSLDVTVNVNSNPASTEFAIHETSTGNYVQIDGSLGASAYWQTSAAWGTKTVTGLTTNAPYTFEVKARNGASTPTVFGSTTTLSTTSGSNDQTSNVVAPTLQITAGDIASSLTTSGVAIDAFKFKISDLATTDALATKVTQIKILKTGTAVLNSAVAGAQLFDGATQITTATPVIGVNDITFPITSGNLDIGSGASREITLKVWLSTTVTDNSTLVFSVPQTSHAFIADATGSAFATDFGAAVTGNTMTIRVAATKLLFTSAPSTSACPNTNLITQPVVKATDANGNVDADFTGAVTITNSGSIGMSNYVINPSVSGVAGFSSLQFTTIGNVTLSTSNSSGLTDAPATASIAISVTDATSQAATIGNASSSVSWTYPACYDEIIIVAHTASISGTPTGTYTYNSLSYTNALNPDFPSGGKVVYNGNEASPKLITDLTNGTPYYFKIFTRKGSDWSSGVQTSATPVDISLVSDYFRSNVISGSWGTAATWQSSHTGTDPWITATITPTSAANTISIRSGDTITIAANVTVDQVVVKSGGVLIYSSGTLTVNDGTGNDIVIESGGIFKHSPATALLPTFNTGATFQIQEGGVLEATTTNGPAANYANDNGSTTFQQSMIWETGGIFYWNNNGSFAASGRTYFPQVTTAIPIFRISGFTSSPGGGSNTVINGKIEVNSSFTWAGAGTKTFRNGIIGTATMSQSTTGQWIISGSTAEIGGIGSLSLGTNGLTINSSVVAIFSSDKTINGGPITLNGTIDLKTFKLTTNNTLTVANGGILKVGSTHASGALVGNFAGGTLTLSTGSTLEYNGLGAQFAQTRTFSSLKINNTNGVTLLGDILVNGTLNFANGLLSTSTYKLILGASGSISNASATNYINGKLAMIYSATGSKTFPIGKGGNYRPVSLNFTALNTNPDTVSIEQTEGAMSGTMPAHTSLFNSRYWTITQSGASTFTYDVTLDGTGFSPIGTAKILKSNGTSVTSYNTTGSYTATGLNSFSYFGLGDYVNTTPTVSTSAISAINTTTATAGGNVSDDGGVTITARGVCYGTTLNPDTSGTKTSEAGTTGSFVSHLINLTANTTYHVRAYAINSIGLAYGSDVSFVTAPAIPTATAATNNTANGFTSNWDAVAGADGYGLYVSTDINFGSFITGYNDRDVLNVTTYDISGLNPHTTYYYRVYAYNSNLDVTENSNTITVLTTPATATASITHPSCTVGTGTIEITAPLGADYEYSLDLGTYQSSTTFAYVSSGGHTIYVRSASVPLSISEVSIVNVNDQPATPSLPVVSETQPNCTTLGSIEVTSPLGTGMTYSIGLAYQSEVAFASLAAGTYTVTAKNSDGCISQGFAVIIQNQPST